MLRRVSIAGLAAFALLSAQDSPAPPKALKESDQISALLTTAALALRDGPAPAFTALFDPKTPGLGQISKDVARTLAEAMVDSEITVASDTGSDSVRELQLAWKLRVTAHDTSSGLTTRSAHVSVKVERRGDKWLFTEFTPTGFFRPGAGTEAWDLVSAAASAMRNGNPEGFLADFDRKMPDYQRLAQAVRSLVRTTTVGDGSQPLGGVESSLELLSVEGTDTERTLEIDWTLTTAQGAFAGNTRSEGIGSAQWHDTVHVKAALQGKKWRLVGIDPIAFFEHAPAAR